MSLSEVVRKTVLGISLAVSSSYAASCTNTNFLQRQPVQQEQQLTDQKGMVTFSNGAQAKVKDKQGQPLGNIKVNYFYTGEKNTFLALDATGKYFPERVSFVTGQNQPSLRRYRRSTDPVEKVEEIVLEEVCKQAGGVCEGVELVQVAFENANSYMKGDILGEDENVNKYCQTLEQITTNTIDVPIGIVLLAVQAAGYDTQVIKLAVNKPLKYIAEKYIIATYGQQPGYEVWVPKTIMSVELGQCGKAVCPLTDGDLQKIWDPNLPYWRIVGGCVPGEKNPPPAGGKIAFASEHPHGIHTINPDGTGQYWVTEERGEVSSGNPSWSPDGTKIAFDSEEVKIFIVNGDGSNLHYITNGVEPSWSPDGTKIAFRYYPGGRNIHLVNVDGSNQRALTNINNNVQSAYSPSWSPDGTKLVFEMSDEGDFDIYVINADGSNQQKLPDSYCADFSSCNQRLHPRYSSDGTRITYHCRPQEEIRAMDVTGSNCQVLLTKLADADFNGSYDLVRDGTKIAFGAMNNAGSNRIYIKNLQNGELKEIAVGWQPDWFP